MEKNRVFHIFSAKTIFSDKRLLSLIAVAAVYVLWDANCHFNETDECWFAQIIVQMVENQDFLTPRFGAMPEYSKPPLYYWLSAFATIFSPTIEFAMRLVSGLSFIAILLLLADLCDKWFTRRTALLSTAVFFLCYDHLFIHGYKNGVMEGLLHLEYAAIFTLNLRLAEKPSLLYWIALGLAMVFLTKTAFIFFPLVLVLLHLWLLRKKISLSAKMLLGATGVFLLVVTPWFVLLIVANGPQVLSYMFKTIAWDKFIGSFSSFAQLGESLGRSEPLYVLHHFFTYGQPWSLLLCPACLRLFYWRRIDQAQRRILLLCVVWIILVFAIFLVSEGRWSWYISSVYFPIAILVATMFDEFLQQETTLDKMIWPLVTIAFFMASPPFFYNPYANSSGPAPLHPISAIYLYLFALSILPHALPFLADSYKHKWIFAIATIAVTYNATLYFLALEPLFLPTCTILALCATLWYWRRGKKYACLAACFAIAASYLLAPLPFALQKNELPVVSWMKRQIAEGHLQNGKQLICQNRGKYFFVVLYQQFSDDYEIILREPDTVVIHKKR